jgi:hypothetical protein
VTIEGVQITEGKEEFPGQTAIGAGIAQLGGSLTVIDCLVDANEIEVGSNGFPYGGGIDSAKGSASLTLRDTVVSDNRIRGQHNWGGGVNAEGGVLTIEGGAIKGNVSRGESMFGGGLYFDGTKATISNVAITGNEIDSLSTLPPEGEGAGLDLLGGTGNTVENVTIAKNRAVVDDPAAEEHVSMVGGGAVIAGTGTTVVNTTIADNSLDETVKAGTALGGGLLAGGTTKIVNSTLADNAIDGEGTTLTTEGGDLYVGGGRVEVENSLFTEGTVRGGGQNCAHPGGELVSLGHNIDSLFQCDFDATGDQSDTDPKVRPLAENGGPVETVALKAGSPAIDAAAPGDCPTTDARGVLRPAGGGCDIGAFEVGTPSATTEAASGAGTDHATLTGDATNPALAAGGVSFEYGTSTSYGSRTPAQAIGATTRGAGFTAAVGGLAAGTTYHFRIVVTNAEGTAAGRDMTFTTPEPPSSPSGSGPRLTVKHLKGLRVEVHCTGAPCRGKLVTTARSGKRTVVVAKATFSVAAGATKKLALKPTGKGKALLALPGKHAVVVKATLAGGKRPVSRPIRFKLR